MHCTQRQCFETIRDCRHSGVTRTCTYTCTHADIPAPRYSIIATSLLHFTSRSRLRATMHTYFGPNARRERETEHEIHHDISVLTRIARLIHMQSKKVSFAMEMNFIHRQNTDTIISIIQKYKQYLSEIYKG